MNNRLACSLSALTLVVIAACSARTPDDDGVASSSAAAFTSPYAGFDPLPAPGCASAIAVATHDGDAGVPERPNPPWILGCGETPTGDHDIFVWTGSAWEQVAGAASSIAVSLFGGLFTANAEGAAFERFASGELARLPGGGCVHQIVVGPHRELWALGCDAPTADGNSIYRYVDATWTRVPGAASRIAISPESTPWVVNARGEVFKWRGDGFAPIEAPGCASDIGVSGNDTAWIVGCTPVSDAGNGIYYLDDISWRQVPGAATRIAVGFDGRPYVVDRAGQVWAGRKTP